VPNNQPADPASSDRSADNTDLFGAAITDAIASLDDEWDEEVQVLVTLRVKAKPNLEFFEGWLGRTPLDAAMTGAWRGGCTLDRVDGFADLNGEVDVIDVQEGY